MNHDIIEDTKRNYTKSLSPFHKKLDEIDIKIGNFFKEKFRPGYIKIKDFKEKEFQRKRALKKFSVLNVKAKSRLLRQFSEEAERKLKSPVNLEIISNNHIKERYESQIDRKNEAFNKLFVKNENPFFPVISPHKKN